MRMYVLLSRELKLILNHIKMTFIETKDRKEIITQIKKLFNPRILSWPSFGKSDTFCLVNLIGVLKLMMNHGIPLPLNQLQNIQPKEFQRNLDMALQMCLMHSVVSEAMLYNSPKNVDFVLLQTWILRKCNMLSIMHKSMGCKIHNRYSWCILIT